MRNRILYITLTCLAAAPLAYAWWSPVVRHPERLPEAANISTRPAPSHDYVVQVTGRNFRWHFQILEPQISPVTSVLRLPVGSKVRWRLTSDDYIYVFRIPELGINLMAVPQITATAVTTRPNPLAIDLLVDPLCSFRLYHDEWMGRVEFHSNQTIESRSRKQTRGHARPSGVARSSGNPGQPRGR